MNPARRIRPEAKLLNLEPSQQEQLFAWLKLPGNTYRKAIEYCREQFGVSVSTTPLKSFWEIKTREEWEDRLLKTASSTQAQLENVEKTIPEKSQALACDFIQSASELRMQGAPATMIEPLVDMALKILKRMDSREQIDLDVKKFQFDAAKACLAALPALKQIAHNTTMDEQAKLTAVREKLFGELPE